MVPLKTREEQTTNIHLHSGHSHHLSELGYHISKMELLRAVLRYPQDQETESNQIVDTLSDKCWKNNRPPPPLSFEPPNQEGKGT